MYSAVQATLHAMIAHLNADRWAELVKTYDYPFVLNVRGRMMVLHSPDDAMEAWQIFRGSMTAKGHMSSTVRLTALELPRAGRFRAWAELTHTDAAGEISGQSKIIYYFRDHGDHHRLEMQSVIAPVLPRFQALAQSIRKVSSGAAAGHH